MPDLNTLLNTANAQSESVPTKKKFSRGIRPDHIARGEVLPVNQSAPNTPTPIESAPNVKLVVNGDKTEHKQDTNRAQTEHKSIHKQDTNRAQTGHKNRPENSINSLTEHKPDTQPDTPLDTKWTQTTHKVNTKFAFSTLVGLQKELALLIYKSCQKNRSKVSDQITLDFVSTNLNIRVGSVKTTFRRLEEKQIIHRAESKNGRGGWTKFELSNDVFSEMLQLETEHKLDTNRTQSAHKQDTKQDTQPDTSVPVVVVGSNFSNTTTTTNDPCFVIPPALQGLVSRKQLTQFVLDGKIGEWEIQLSLDAFAYDLKNGLIQSRSSNPVAVLIGAIKNNGSYNSQKYAELLKTDLKQVVEVQQTLQDSISDVKATKEWSEYQSFKKNDPEAFKRLVSKFEKQGLSNESLIEEFGFMEFKEMLSQGLPAFVSTIIPEGT